MQIHGKHFLFAGSVSTILIMIIIILIILVVFWLHQNMNIVHNIKAMTVSNVGTSNNLLTYYNSGLGIQIQYPSDWTVRDQPNGVEFLSPPIKFVPMQNYSYGLPVTVIPEIVGVAVRNLPVQNISLQQLTSSLINFRQAQNPELAYAAPTRTTLAGEPAFMIPQHVEAGQMKSTEILSKKGNKAYLINYGYYSDGLPQNLQKMIDSLQIIR